MSSCVSLFIFTQAYDIPRLRQDVLDCFYHCYNDEQDYGGFLLGAWDHGIAYGKTAPSSPIRKLLVDAYRMFMIDDHGGKVTNITEHPKEFLLDVLQSYVDATPKQIQTPYESTGLNPCDYYEHASKAEQQACKIRVKF
ncbi:hypothetical protein BU23DRAFT_63552 [Bimuria novae-zelandiae CBS 107.79]|uniref:Uncharacterized protein n=1 Tax=Bimuria novae-zelandiae CBS 107.79 TaxID=1447943 RepID=A0A6A5UGS2_9PLEO|nr:hypothetical protein BU23DRAFT_63552 [Bimuria novae-zelandiae CBS 107.79]